LRLWAAVATPDYASILWRTVLSRRNIPHPKRSFDMSRFVITVDFQLHPGAMREFLPLMVENANKSRDLEPGCERFDVLLPKDAADRVLLYEIYTDKAAFGEHLKAAHFLSFDSATKSLVKEKKVVEYELENDDGS
jgi:quinol monooxygenase YgiN